MRHAESARMLRTALPIGLAAAAVAAGYGFSVGLAGYFVYLGTSVVVAAIAILGLGIVTGSAGMISLCQLTFAAVGAWVVSWLSKHAVPGGLVVWLLLGGLAAGAVGVVVGLPALRLRGINLAVVTLGLAAAVDLALVELQFPGTRQGLVVTRPDAFADDRAYFFLSVVVLVCCGLLVHVAQRNRWGSSWRFIAFSERGTAAVGAGVAPSKLTAFAVSAALGGVSGGLLAGQVGQVFAASFTPAQSLAMYVLAIVAGSHLVDMAVFGGLLWVAVPELLKRWGVPQDWGFVVFGALGIQALTSKTNLGSVLRQLWWRYWERGTRTGNTLGSSSIEPLATESNRECPGRKPILTVSGVRVTFGEVTALDNVRLDVAERSVTGLIGPNGAGKSTLIDVISGFLPPDSGVVTVAGDELGGRTPARRARDGLRRTFQQDRVPPTLTVGTYVRFVARGHATAADVVEVLDFFGCPPAHTRLTNVDVGTRRVVEVAAHVLSRPRVLLLDEPAAGLSQAEHAGFGDRIRALPDRFGISVLLIEHDLDMVRAVCDTITVLDFGQVLATGGHEEVLGDPEVIKAYMGDGSFGDESLGDESELTT